VDQKCAELLLCTNKQREAGSQPGVGLHPERHMLQSLCVPQRHVPRAMCLSAETPVAIERRGMLAPHLW